MQSACLEQTFPCAGSFQAWENPEIPMMGKVELAKKEEKRIQVHLGGNDNDLFLKKVH
jgi:hypothetical protein